MGRIVLAAILLALYAARGQAGVEYSTFFGGSQGITNLRAETDSQGFIYLAGISGGLDFPVTRGPSPSLNSGVFVAKIDPRMPGSAGLIYSRFVLVAEELNGMAVTPDGKVYLAGAVYVRNMPTTPGAFQPKAPAERVSPARDAFLTVVDPARGAGNELVYSTYLGGTLQDRAVGLRIDGQGRAVLWGRTDSVDFPATSGAIAEVQRGSLFPSSSWVAMIDPSASGASSLVYSTPIAASVVDLEVEPSGRIHFFGNFLRDLFPGFRTTPGAFRPECQANGLAPCGPNYYAVLDPSPDPNAALVYSSGAGVDGFLSGLALDPNGRAYLVGLTRQRNAPSTITGLGEECRDTQPGCEQVVSQDIYLLSLDIERQGDEGLYFAARVGGNGSESSPSIALDSEGSLYVVATTRANDFPVTPEAFDTTCGGVGFGCPDELVVMRLDPAIGGPGALRFASYLGGNDRESVDFGSDIVAGTPGVVYVSGVNSSADFPLPPNATDTEWYDVQRPFVAAIDTRASGDAALQYASFLGDRDGPGRLSIANSGQILYAGETTDPDFVTTPGALDRTCSFGQILYNDTCPRNGFAMLIDPLGGSEATIEPSTLELTYNVPDPLPLRNPVTLTVNQDAQFDAFGVSGEGDWLSTSVAGLTGSGEVEILASPGAFTYGEYEGRVRFVSDDPVLRRGTFVKLTIGQPPPPTIAAVVHAADFRERPVAAGQIISIFGTHLGPTHGALSVLDINGRIPYQLTNVTVRFNEYAAAPIYARHDQINVIVPYEVAGERVLNVRVYNPGGESLGFGVDASPSAPGLFTANGLGTGPAAAHNQDGVLNTAASPAARGEIVVLYATGEGALDPPADVFVPAGDEPGKPVLDVEVTIGGAPTEILYAGQAPGFSGLFQVNVRVPPQSPTGDAVAVELEVGGVKSTPGVTLAIQ